MLESLEYVFDEGVYIQQARLVLAGQLPYRDFFNHQTPLYPLTLATVVASAPDALWLYRLPSILATALCGVAVHRIARRLTTEPGALAGALLFFTAPLQYFGLVAMPNALMLVTSTVAFALVWYGSRRVTVALGALLFAISILFKPIAVSAALAAGIALAARRDRWPDLLVATLVGGVSMAFAWALFDVLSDGAFTELLWLQATRHAEGGGFELMKQYESIGGPLEGQGISSALAWNIRNHALTFLPFSLMNRTFPLTLFALAGQILVWSRHGERFHDQRLALTLWWAVPLAFSIFVWNPAFQYYFVQYLPPLAVLAAIFLAWLWERPRARALIVAAVAAVAMAGPWQITVRQNDYTLLARPEDADESWLLFDPFLNFVSGTEPACGLVDPFNVCGDASLVAIGTQEFRARFHLEREELITCLEADPSIRIGLGYWSTWFVDAPLAAYLARLPPERFVPMRLHYRPPGSGMPPSPEKIRHGLSRALRRKLTGTGFRVPLTSARAPAVSVPARKTPSEPRGWPAVFPATGHEKRSPGEHR